MNLAVLKKSRRRPETGDIFAMLPPDGAFLFGRVIATNVNAGGFEGSNLIYVYRNRSVERSSPPKLSREELLLPPMMTNNLPWSKGYFEFLENRALEAADRFPVHCFRDTRGWYFEETGRRLTGIIDPVGTWGLHSFRTIDDEISKALGIPLAAPA
ncbi:Imm26 family immunity protein [Microvirga guangxiensis]|uniref:Immunity protein 26 n=1 Tax=Microvirga guangxiensis TaxID=549386 RepID=A0A1G5BHP6_9HYPH|nr:Imm26 family immunity protein [Microvirga guangxiensis]SCX89665.1 Immunity protein 26 [Microvirga guangxiensis]